MKENLTIDKIQPNLWVGRIQAGAITMVAYLRRYDDRVFTPGVAAAELDEEEFSRMSSACLELDERVRAGEENPTLERDGVSYSARVSRRNPANTVVAWRHTGGELAGLGGFLTVAGGRKGRYVVAERRGGAVQIRARLARMARVAPVVTDEDGDHADMERTFYAPIVRTALDAVGLAKNMAIQEALHAEAQRLLAEEVPEEDNAEVPF